MPRPTFDPRRYEYYVYVAPKKGDTHVATCPNFPDYKAQGTDRAAAVEAMGRKIQASLMTQILQRPHNVPTPIVKGGTYRLWRPSYEVAIRLFLAEVYVNLLPWRAKRWERDVLKDLKERYGYTEEGARHLMANWSLLDIPIDLGVVVTMLKRLGYAFAIIDTHP